MIKKRKVCVITGTRAEYGLLYWLIKEIEGSEELDLQLIVTGMHLSPEFGLTFQQIEKDGFIIDRKIEMLLSSDTAAGISKSMGIAMLGFADAFEELSPDLIVILGDRYEMLSAASAAMVACIPIAHIHGGETTEGVFDESIRHSITKMSFLHFTAAEIYRQRVVQLGEQPDRVFNVGALGLDNIQKLNLLERHEFEESINFKLAKHNLLVTFHPATLEENTAKTQINELLLALGQQKDAHFIFTKTNSDPSGRIVNQKIDTFVQKYPEKAVSYSSLGQLRYLSAMKFVDGVIGNSSSGLIEAPSFKLGTVNIGDRQRGRIKSSNVIDCLPNKDSINEAISRLYSKEFQSELKKVTNPYGSPGASKKVVQLLINHPWDMDLKKSFYDLP